jgi:hypothetical protein
MDPARLETRFSNYINELKSHGIAPLSVPKLCDDCGNVTFVADMRWTICNFIPHFKCKTCVTRDNEGLNWKPIYADNG